MISKKVSQFFLFVILLLILLSVELLYIFFTQHHIFNRSIENKKALVRITKMNDLSFSQKSVLLRLKSYGNHFDNYPYMQQTMLLDAQTFTINGWDELR